MENSLTITKLEKEFDDFILGPLNLELEQGKVTGYIGPNGAGKTTTMQCIAGLIKPDKGEIKIFGKQNTPNSIEWKYNLGYVDDKHIFYEKWSCAQNLKFFSQFYPNWDWDFANELIKRFEISLNKKVTQLSTGNKVKLSIVRALSYRPKLLILDEPTIGLDPIARTELLNILFEIIENNNNAIFYSTHILSDIDRLADELIFIINGKIKLQAPKEDLLEKWRTISFKAPNNQVDLNNEIIIQIENNYYKIISPDYNETLKRLQKSEAQNITVNRMNIDEISVQILKQK